MSSTASTSNPSKIFIRILYVSLLGLAAYYLYKSVFPKLTLTEEAYGTYYFERINWVFPHIVTGVLATLIGPFQFIQKFRDANLKRHRLLGKTYLICILIAGISSVYMALTSDVNFTYMTGLLGLGLAWMSTSAMAFLSIRKKKIDLHKEWMIRSYVVTFAFTSFRFIYDLIEPLGLGTAADILAFNAWFCWAIPLLITELILQGRKIYK
jgi:uncharacterized membrane protein